MFHMLSCFNLRPGVTIEEFRRAVADFGAHLEARKIIHSVGPIGRRHRHAVMDTDSERDHEYFFIMSFRDRAQCDRAVAHIYAKQEPGESIHAAVLSSVADPIFICWEDI